MKSFSYYTILIISLAFWMTSCGDEKQEESTAGDSSAQVQNAPGKSQAEIDDEKIQAFLKANNIDAESHESGLYYVITDPGQGDHPAISSTVIMHYRGSKLDGSVFESSYESGNPLNYPLGRLIRGWQIGVPLIGKGGKATLFIPSGLAYGPQSPGPGIEANEVLIFDVELLDFQ